MSCSADKYFWPWTYYELMAGIHVDAGLESM